MPISLDLWDSYGGRESEGLFSRDEDGNLIRRVAATRDELRQLIDVVIDGVVVKDIPLAQIVRDAQGIAQYDADGLPKVRKTTIYDAAMELVRRGHWTKDELERRIPVLCHKEHLNPVAVCRMCSVHVIRVKKSTGKKSPGDKLVPACQHEIQRDMEVTTQVGAAEKPKDGERDFPGEVFASIRVLTEYLVADHYKPPGKSEAAVYKNELATVAKNLNVPTDRVRVGLPSRMQEPNNSRNTVRHPKSRPSVPLPMADDSLLIPALPYSSRAVAVDHDRCIVCDRCVRACHDVRPFKVIGHTGKGYQTRISFDLDEIMNDSNCVQCGECMNSCPTGALQLNKRIVPKPLREALGITAGSEREDEFLADIADPNQPIQSTQTLTNPNTRQSANGFLSAEEMQQLEFLYVPEGGTPQQPPPPQKFKPFEGIPLSYLRWNEGAVRRRTYKKGDVLCVQGHFGNTAFFLQKGSFGIWKRDERQTKRTGLLGRLFGRGSKMDADDLGSIGPYKPGPQDTILGELATMANQPRAASITVESDEAIVIEVTRNMLDMVQRNEAAREKIGLVYTRNAIRACLGRRSENPDEPTLFQRLSFDEQQRLIKLLVEGVRDPSRKIKEETVRESHTKDGKLIVYPKTEPNADIVRAKLRRCQPGEIILKEGDLARDFYIIRYGSVKISKRVEDREVVLGKQTDNEYFGEGALLDPDARRTATVTALDTVELVRIPRFLFSEMLIQFPTIKDTLLAVKQTRSRGGQQAKPVVADFLTDYINQGLYQGRNLLVLDLESCTRCDECTRACDDSHGKTGYSRLLREGMRFGNYLVAASCRACHKPYCMDGCPVDAIHRDGAELHIKIDNHCIRCGLCERNCPYGAIQIPDKQEVELGLSKVTKAINCDKCYELVPEGDDPFCVQSCPHDAAFRMPGQALYQIVTGQKVT